VTKLEQKLRHIIGPEDVGGTFADNQLRQLVAKTKLKLPPNFDWDAFKKGVQEAAHIFVRDARVPTDNELRSEIGKLLKAADRRSYAEVAGIIESLSPRARAMLGEWGTCPSVNLVLPPPEALRDPERREAAAIAIATLCQFGGELVPGRLRSSGKRSRPALRPLLTAPRPRRAFPKRDAELDFVMWLQIAYLEAANEIPSRTARNPDKSRDLGPFARFARECLRLVGANYASVTELMNELHRHRRQSARLKGSCQLSNPDR
jgi:hypothetical protein